MQGADGDGCRCGAVSVGGGGVDHDLGVHAGGGQRFGGSGVAPGVGASVVGDAARKVGGRSVVRPYIALEIIAVKVGSPDASVGPVIVW